MLYALGPTSVLFGKHIDKMDVDAAKGVRSLPVILGERLARHCVIVMLSLQYVLALVLILRGDFHWVMAVLLLNLPGLWRLIASYRTSKPLWFSAYAFDHTRKFSGLFLLGLFVDILLRQ